METGLDHGYVHKSHSGGNKSLLLNELYVLLHSPAINGQVMCRSFARIFGSQVCLPCRLCSDTLNTRVHNAPSSPPLISLTSSANGVHQEERYDPSTYPAVVLCHDDMPGAVKIVVSVLFIAWRNQQRHRWHLRRCSGSTT